jgi:hypothetical protein
MYDDVRADLIPADALYVAYYVNGRYANGTAIRKRLPHARLLSIAVTAGADAECLDIETGDARPDQAPAWVKRQLARGVDRPVCYANRSTMPAVISALRKAGIRRNQVRLWVADYTFRSHFPVLRWGLLPTQADGCQWTDRSHGRSLDQSVLRDDFFGARPKPAAPKPAPKEPAEAVTDGAYIYLRDKDGQIRHEPLTKAGASLRFGEWQTGRYQELRFKRA